MKKLTAAFLWDNNSKSISFMIVNQNYKVLTQPRKYKLAKLELKQFKVKAKKIILTFFSEIKKQHQQYPLHKIEIEYKIIHRVMSPLAHFYRPTSESAFVRSNFLKNYALTKASVLDMNLAKQLRSRLKKRELDQFKKTIRSIALVKPAKHNQYQFHLWTLATHATQKNYHAILNRLLKQQTHKFSGLE